MTKLICSNSPSALDWAGEKHSHSLYLFAVGLEALSCVNTAQNQGGFFFVISARKDGDVQASDGEDVPLPSRDVNLEK